MLKVCKNRNVRRRQLTIRNMTLSAALLAFGFVINTVSPPIFFGLKPDFMLIFLFTIILGVRNFRLTIAVSLTAGIILAFTTNFPGGQIPNVIDKAVIGVITYLCTPLLKGKKRYIQAIYVICGSFISGFIFLLTANLFYKLPNELGNMVFAAILPLAILNGLAFLPIKKMFDMFYNQ